ncbi:hypothetical protein BG004_000243 [Podila humilis]|nr:hypothetical protein BG004_000243 [Podila humilis]
MTSSEQILEEYALHPDKRDTLIQKITPGTDDFHRYKLLLHLQRLQESPELITTEAMKATLVLLNAARKGQRFVDDLATQFALLFFPLDPKPLLKLLSFNTELLKTQALTASDSDPSSPQQTGTTFEDVCKTLSTHLSPRLLEPEAILKKLMDDIEKDLTTFTITPTAMSHLLAIPEFEPVLLNRLKPESLMKFFSRINLRISSKSLEMVNQADGSQVDRLIVKIILRLHREGQLSFDDNLTQYKSLTRTQLQWIREEQPSVMHIEGFVSLLEKQIFPRPFVESEEEAQDEWLDRMLEFVDSLSPKFDRYKLAVYLMSLERDLIKGIKDKDKFMRAKHLLNDTNLVKLTEQTILKFAPDNKTKFLPSDGTVFKLTVKNSSRILIRIFEVKTFEYFQQYTNVAGHSLNLDGLTPNWEKTLLLDHPPLLIHDISVELPELGNRRGAFVMDVISNGENSCIYFTKGNLDFIERQSEAGHILTVIDEKQQQITEDVDIWFNGYYYKPNEAGDIVIPYHGAKGTSTSSLFINHDGFTSRRFFKHLPETYSMTLACYVDSEALVAGSTAKVLLKPSVKLVNKVTCPVSLLFQTVLQVSTMDLNGIESTKTFSDFKLHDVDWSEYSFYVPEDLSEVTFSVTTKIKNLASGKHDVLTEESSFTFNRPLTDTTVTVEQFGRQISVPVHGEITTVLKKAHAGYEVHVLGKNGESRPDIPLKFSIEHALRSSPFIVYLKTDDQGAVYLGPLDGVDKLVCQTTDCSWDLILQNTCSYPEVIFAAEGDEIQVPFHWANTSAIRHISLYGRLPNVKLTHLTEDFTSRISLQDGVLKIPHLERGYYLLTLSENIQIEITVANPQNTTDSIPGLKGFHLGANPMLEIPDSLKHPLLLQTPIACDELQYVKFQLCNWTPDTRIAIFASKFVADDRMFGNLAVEDFQTPWSQKTAELLPLSYRTGRVLGEEYQYILNRKAQSTHWAGNLLTKPSVLLSPWSVASTTMATQTMAAQNSNRDIMHGSSNFGGADRGGVAVDKMGAKRHRRILPKPYPCLLNFLVHPGVALFNIKPDAESGQLSLPYGMFRECSYLRVLVVDGEQAVQRTLSISHSNGSSFQKRDLRFKSELDHRRHFIGERVGVNLDPKLTIASNPATATTTASASVASITLASNGSSSSSVRVINSVRQVYDVMLTLLEKHEYKQSLRHFGFIVDWQQFSLFGKNEKYSKWNCHELNLFLYKKDREYFDAVVKPFLQNKLVKSFMDNYLIGASLEFYTDLKEFDRLTSLEKCLLAQRIPSLRSSVVQWIKSRVHGTRTASNIKLFRTVMSSGELEKLDGSDDTQASDDDSDGDFPRPTAAPITPMMPQAVMQQAQQVQYQSQQPQQAAAPYLQASIQQRLALQQQQMLQQQQQHQQQQQQQQASQEFALRGYGAASNSNAVPLATSGGLFGAAPSRGFGSPAPMPAPPAGSASFGFGSARSATAARGSANVADARARSEQMVSNQFKPVDLTKEMAETYYYNRQDFTSSSEDKVNAFWLDFVQWDEAKGGSFLSQNFVANANSFTDAMATIALLDIEFKPKDASIKRSVEQNLVVSSPSPAIVFHSSTKELLETRITGSVLVMQQYFSQHEMYVYDETLATNVRSYIAADAEFRPLESYGAHVVLMNATPNPMKLHLEVQIPQGSISIYDSVETGQDVTLPAHGTFQYEYKFYFPEQGDFPHYPAHVSNYETIVAYASPSMIRVRELQPGLQTSTTDTTSWQHVLSNGTKDDILAKLSCGSLKSLPIQHLLPRLYSDGDFLKHVTQSLRARHEYIDQIWRVSLATNDCESLVQEYLSRQPVVDKVGDWFTSKILVKRPQSRTVEAAKEFQVLEYFPLINARVHKATRNATILNDRFNYQYKRFLKLLCQKPKHDIHDLLLLVVYLLAQDRILEAKEKFIQLSSLVEQCQFEENELGFSQQIQYDYIHAYLRLCVEVQVDDSHSKLELDIQEIQDIIAKYKEYPVKRWRELFSDMQEYLDEILLVASVTSDDDEAGEIEDASADVIMGEPTEEELDDFDHIDIDDGDEDDEEFESVGEENGSGDGNGSGDNMNATKKKKKRASRVPVAADFKIGSDSVITVRHRGVQEITIEYYAIDAEIMFSAAPLTFSDQGESSGNNKGLGISKSINNNSNIYSNNDNSMAVPQSAVSGSDSYRMVKPNAVSVHGVKRAISHDGLLKVPVLPQYLNTNVMISISTTPQSANRTWKAYCSQTIDVQCLEQTGTIKVITKAVETLSVNASLPGNTSSSVSKKRKRSDVGRPIRGGYVKVYAELKSGSGDKSTVFWKDGYTDLVGRFAYATVSTAITSSSNNNNNDYSNNVMSKRAYSASGSGGGGGGGGLSDVKRFVLFVDGGKEGCVVKTVPVPPF